MPTSIQYELTVCRVEYLFGPKGLSLIYPAIFVECVLASVKCLFQQIDLLHEVIRVAK